MQMCQIGTFSRTNGSYLAATLHLLTALHFKGFQVGVDRLNDRAELVSIWQAMSYEDHFAPTWTGTSRIDHLTGSCCVNSIAQIGVPPADAVEIVSQMTLDAKGLGVVGQCAMLRPHGHVKACRHGQGGHFERCQAKECRIERLGLMSQSAPETQPDHAKQNRHESQG